MKKIILPIFVFATTLGAICQSNIIDLNEIKLYIDNEGTLAFNGIESMHQAPKSGDVGCIYAASIWIGAMDDDGDLHLAAQTYRQSGSDFWPGPIATNYSSAYDERYNRTWVIKKTTIQDHIDNWESAGYVVPDIIAEWPAMGDTTNGEPKYLAPFYDYNVNDIYDPENGDYPIIRGDEALYFILNDARELHASSGGEPLQIEIHGMAFQIDTTESFLNQNIFVNYSIFNRSDNNYTNLYFGTWFDFDIGYGLDDYIGSDSLLNLFYGYNSDSNDEGGYGTSIPAQGTLWLNEPLSTFMYYNNDFSEIGEPESPEEFYNYLQANWKDGTSATFGGNGYGGVVETNFVFSGNPGSASEWSEVSENNPAGDRRGLGAVGPLTLLAGESKCLDIALPFAIVDGTDSVAFLQAVDLLKVYSQNIIDYYDENINQCMIENEVNPSYNPEDTSLLISQLQSFKITVYPNPATDKFMINISESNSQKNVRVLIRNSFGELIKEETFINTQILEISTVNFPIGFYFVNVNTESGSQDIKLLEILR